MKILHIIRNVDEKTAIELAKFQSKSNDVAVLLIQDGVYIKLDKSFNTYACLKDVEARNISVDYKLVDYSEIVKLIFEYDKAIVW